MAHSRVVGERFAFDEDVWGQEVGRLDPDGRARAGPSLRAAGSSAPAAATPTGSPPLRSGHPRFDASHLCEHAFVSIKGGSSVTFQRAVAAGHALPALAAATELGRPFGAR